MNTDRSQNPMKEPNVEQTASVLSRTFYVYMDPFVFTASKATSLTTEELPPLSDTDDIKNLADRTRKVCFLPYFSEYF